jgi:hypothetical protein
LIRWTESKERMEFVVAFAETPLEHRPYERAAGEG